MSTNFSHRIDSATRMVPESSTIPEEAESRQSVDGPSRVPKPRMLDRPTRARETSHRAAADRRETAADGPLEQRIDSQPMAGSQPIAAPTSPEIGDFCDSDGREDWLKLQAIDLIDRIRAWSADLDAREAQLNVRASLQDHRERHFRLLQQDAATELAEQQRAIARIRSEIEAQARRIAFQS